MDQGPEEFFAVGAKMFMERSYTAQMEKIWRLICIETYRNEKLKEFFKKQLLEGPLDGWERIFHTMIEKKMIKPFNPRTLAYEYWSFAVFLIFDWYILEFEEDFESGKKIGLEKLNDHTRFLLDAIKY